MNVFLRLLARFAKKHPYSTMYYVVAFAGCVMAGFQMGAKEAFYVFALLFILENIFRIVCNLLKF